MSTQSMTIGKVAQLADITVETIRYYEREGMIETAPRSDSGYRKYSSHVVRRLKFIKRAQTLGFSLRQILEILDLEVTPGADCGEVKRIAKSKIKAIDNKIDELIAMRDALESITIACTGDGPVQRCAIMEAIEAIEANHE